MTGGQVRQYVGDGLEQPTEDPTERPGGRSRLTWARTAQGRGHLHRHRLTGRELGRG